MRRSRWEPQAFPQSCAEARNQSASPEIVVAAQQRDISRVVHFTRTSGLTGILFGSAVKSRRYLPEDERLKYVYEENAPNRSRDEEWHGYVSLSVTDINMRMYKYSVREHPQDQWVILEFDPDILGDPGVVFCTSNNAYEVTHRCRGIRGFEQMFASSVPWGHYGATSSRSGRAPNQPTNPQAEVLYPCELGLDRLDMITVPDTATYDTVQAIFANLTGHDSAVRVSAEAFR